MALVGGAACCKFAELYGNQLVRICRMNTCSWRGGRSRGFAGDSLKTVDTERVAAKVREWFEGDRVSNAVLKDHVCAEIPSAWVFSSISAHSTCHDSWL